MSTKSKVIVTISSLLLVVALIVMGIFAFSNQTYTVKNKVNVSASKNINAQVTVNAKNDGKDIQAENNVLDFVYNTENSSSGYVELAHQKLKQKGSQLEIVIEITNRVKSAYGFTAVLNEQSIKATKDKNVSVEFKYLYNDQQLDYDQASTTTINPGETMTISIIITLQSEVYNVEQITNANLTLTYVD